MRGQRLQRVPRYRGVPPIPEMPRPGALGVELEMLDQAAFRAELLGLILELRQVRLRDFRYWVKRWYADISTSTDQAYESGLLSEDRLLDFLEQMLEKVDNH